MGTAMVNVLGAMLGGAFAVFLTAPALILMGLLERFGPVYGKRPAFKSWLKGFAFQVVGISLGNVLLMFTGPWLPRFHPLWPAMWVGAAFVFSDFLHYWEHRAEHWVFWRIHAVHHSTEDLCSTSNFHHFTDGLLFAAIYGIPMSLVTHDPLAGIWAGTGVQIWATFTHSPTKLSIGPLNWIFQDNRLHRIHHSAEPQHWDKNFGAVFQIWDTLFGTSYRPARGEWPETGIAHYREIERITDYLARPLMRYRIDADRAAKATGSYKEA